jgi:hypothetical protein
VEQFVDGLFTNGSGQKADRLVLTVDLKPPRDLGGWCRGAVVDRILTLASSLSGTPAAPTDLWVVTEYDGGGIRGIFSSQRAAESEIAAICAEHPDLTRSDFIIEVQRVRPAASLQAEPSKRCEHAWTAWHGVGDLPNGVIVAERHCGLCRIYESREIPIQEPPAPLQRAEEPKPRRTIDEQWFDRQAERTKADAETLPDWVRDASASVRETSEPNLVAGVRMERSIADFIRSCNVDLVAEQESISPNNGLIAVLCDAVRLASELIAKSAVVSRETNETPLERLKDVAAMLDHFQQNYQANTGDPMPGNSHYSGKLMAIVEAARAALQEAQHGR